MNVIDQKRLRTWEANVGIACFIAGLLTPLLGSLLTFIGWIVGAAIHPWIHIAATALFIVAIPLILFAGFCLDWAAQGQKRRDCDETQRGSAAPAQIAIVGTILGAALPVPTALGAKQHTSNERSNDVLARGKPYAEFDVSFPS
jgi:hypothetical protein